MPALSDADAGSGTEREELLRRSRARAAEVAYPDFQGQGRRYQEHRPVERQRRPEAERFWSHVERSEHWIHDGHRSADGYPFAHWHGKDRLARAVSWELAHGPVPEGTVIRQLCGERACVRPEHLALSHARRGDPTAQRLDRSEYQRRYRERNRASVRAYQRDWARRKRRAAR